MPIENIESVAAYISTTVLGGFAGYFIRVFIEHRLAKSLANTNRRADAARSFRATVNEAMTLFQKPTETWGGNNRTAHAMRNFVRVVDLAAKDYAGLCVGCNKTRFTKKWLETKEYCSTTLPRAVTNSSNSIVSANDAKNTFLKHVEELLECAET